MRVIYTSKGMSKKFGVRVIYRKIQYIYIYSLCVCVCVCVCVCALFVVDQDTNNPWG